jgi:hypothetical protein
LRKAFRQEAVKWGLFLTTVVFVITLKDRLAEVLAVACFLIGLLLNAPIFSRAPSLKGGAKVDQWGGAKVDR